ncbi:MAG: hypothetical protein HQM16_08865 [Deltaproteobacteria bacterium]|nr:hypothetical protein [Deltaproteobacteria bacterium]
MGSRIDKQMSFTNREEFFLFDVANTFVTVNDLRLNKDDFKVSNQRIASVLNDPLSQALFMESSNEKVMGWARQFFKENDLIESEGADLINLREHEFYWQGFQKVIDVFKTEQLTEGEKKHFATIGMRFFSLWHQTATAEEIQDQPEELSILLLGPKLSRLSNENETYQARFVQPGKKILKDSLDSISFNLETGRVKLDQTLPTELAQRLNLPEDFVSQAVQIDDFRGEVPSAMQIYLMSFSPDALDMKDRRDAIPFIRALYEGEQYELASWLMEKFYPDWGKHDLIPWKNFITAMQQRVERGEEPLRHFALYTKTGVVMRPVSELIGQTYWGKFFDFSLAEPNITGFVDHLKEIKGSIWTVDEVLALNDPFAREKLMILLYLNQETNTISQDLGYQPVDLRIRINPNLFEDPQELEQARSQMKANIKEALAYLEGLFGPEVKKVAQKYRAFLSSYRAQSAKISLASASTAEIFINIDRLEDKATFVHELTHIFVKELWNDSAELGHLNEGLATWVEYSYANEHGKNRSSVPAINTVEGRDGSVTKKIFFNYERGKEAFKLIEDQFGRECIREMVHMILAARLTKVATMEEIYGLVDDILIAKTGRPFKEWLADASQTMGNDNYGLARDIQASLAFSLDGGYLASLMLAVYAPVDSLRFFLGLHAMEVSGLLVNPNTPYDSYFRNRAETTRDLEFGVGAEMAVVPLYPFYWNAEGLRFAEASVGGGVLMDIDRGAFEARPFGVLNIDPVSYGIMFGEFSLRAGLTLRGVLTERGGSAHFNPLIGAKLSVGF